MTGRPISPETFALLRRLRVQYCTRPAIFRDLLLLTAWADQYTSAANGTEIGDSGSPVGPWELTTQQAARMAGVTPRAIRRAISEGRLQATKRAGAWFVDMASFTTYRSHTRPAAPMGRCVADVDGAAGQ